MYGAVDSIGKGNPFIKSQGTQGAGQDNPFTAQKSQDQGGFNPFESTSGTVGLGPETQDKQRLTIGIA